MKENHQAYILKAAFKESTAIIFPYDDPVHSGINLAGRSTGAAGARLDDGGGESINSKDIRKDNNLIAKFSWPEETRLSEVDVIKKAKEIAESNDLVKNHIPTMFGDLDPPFITCSTSVIREFLGLGATGARVLRVILFRRLKEIKYLEEEDMVIAFLDCFFCKPLFVVPASSRGTHSGAGHWALWESKYQIEQGDISLGNLMYDPATKRGVLNDFDLARMGGPDRKPSAKNNTGTLPFLALDLLDKSAFNGKVRPLYRHEAESFAWCLICICISMGSFDGQIRTIYPHPLSPWFVNMDICLSSKITLSRGGLLDEIPYHQRTGPLANRLYKYWVTRYQAAGGPGNTGAVRDTLPTEFRPRRKKTAPKTEEYEEPSKHESFRQVYQEFIEASSVVPKSKEKIFYQMLKLVTDKYEYATSADPIQ